MALWDPLILASAGDPPAMPVYQELRRHLGEVFRKLALQKDSKV